MQVEFCLDEWADGRYNSGLKLEDKHYRPKYEIHLAQLQHYHNLNPPVFTNIRKHMFERIWCVLRATFNIIANSRHIVVE